MIQTLRNQLRTLLKDPATLWSDSEVDLSIQSALDDISRVFPLEELHDWTIEWDITDESFTTGAAPNSWIAIAHHFLEYNSETVKNTAGTITYTRDTDYTMDYANGRITHLSGGSMANSTAYKITYKLYRIALDVSQLNNFERVSRVEYPAGQVPQDMVVFSTWNNMVIVVAHSGDDPQQKKLVEGKHIWVYYYARQNIASLPEWLHSLLLKGAEAYALAIKSLDLSHLGKTSLDTSDVVLQAALSSSHLTLWSSALTNAATRLGSANGEMAGIETLLTTDAVNDLALVSTVFNKVDIYLTNIRASLTGTITGTFTLGESVIGSKSGATAKHHYDTTGLLIVKETVGVFIVGEKAIGQSSNADCNITAIVVYGESTKALLAQIATDIANLRTAIETAIDAAASNLGKIFTAGTPNTGDLQDAAGVWTDEQKHILTAAGLPNAETFLELGDDTINVVNLGDNVAALYNQYAVAALAMARAWAQKRQDFLSSATRRAEQVSGYITEATVRLANLRAYIEQARGYTEISDRFISEAVQRLSIATIRISIAQSKLAKCRSWVEQAQVYIAEATERSNQVRQYIDKGQAYQQLSDRQVALGKEFKTLADSYRAEFIMLLRDRAQYRTDMVIQTGRQTK